MDYAEKFYEEVGRVSFNFQTEMDKFQAEHQEKYVENEGTGITGFRYLLDGVIADIALFFTTKIENINESQSYQLNISLSMIRGHYIINNLLLQGNILEASVLIRRQLESLTRIIELDTKPLSKLLRKTPNVFNTLDRFAKKAYKELSEVAHFGTPRVGHLLVYKEMDDGRMGPSLFPEFTMQAIDIYKYHGSIMVLFYSWFREFAEKMYGKDHEKQELYKEIMLKLFTNAMAVGVIVKVDDEDIAVAEAEHDVE